ncbi:MAG: hypothetical protein RLZZ540_2003 [Bacteroidota bacterium]|jgi:hypothetical protein
MREMLNKYGFLIICSLVSFELVADNPTPPPGLPIPPPPGLPVGDGVLFVVGLLFGFYKIYTSMLKKKRSI